MQNGRPLIFNLLILIIISQFSCGTLLRDLSQSHAHARERSLLRWKGGGLGGSWFLPEHNQCSCWAEQWGSWVPAQNLLQWKSSWIQNGDLSIPSQSHGSSRQWEIQAFTSEFSPCSQERPKQYAAAAYLIIRFWIERIAREREQLVIVICFLFYAPNLCMHVYCRLEYKRLNTRSY